MICKPPPDCTVQHVLHRGITVLKRKASCLAKSFCCWQTRPLASPNSNRKNSPCAFSVEIGMCTVGNWPGLAHGGQIQPTSYPQWHHTILTHFTTRYGNGTPPDSEALHWRKCVVPSVELIVFTKMPPPRFAWQLLKESVLALGKECLQQGILQ